MQVYPWQKKEWDQLVNQENNGRLPHAVLLTGPKGLGKKDFAMAFAHRILCEDKEKKPCGHCRGCRFFGNGTHPDFFLIEPEVDSKSIRVEPIRELVDQLNQTSQRNGYQVVVISPVENMNRAAANAFLKTLEEPQGNVLMILVCHQIGKLLPTIRSRCQRISFSCRSSEAAEKWLAESISDKEKAKRLLKVAHFAPLQAMEYDRQNYLATREMIFANLLSIVQQQANPIPIVSRWMKENIDDVLNVIASVLDDLIRLHLGVDSSYLVNQDFLPQLQAINPAFSKRTLLALSSTCQEVCRLNKEPIAINQALLLEAFVLDWKVDHAH